MKRKKEVREIQHQRDQWEPNDYETCQCKFQKNYPTLGVTLEHMQTRH